MFLRLICSGNNILENFQLMIIAYKPIFLAAISFIKLSSIKTVFAAFNYIFYLHSLKGL